MMAKLDFAEEGAGGRPFLLLHGFTGAKDPKRVPDRRDTFRGLQVTVMDNRGLCAHSGFCTDRLSTVFHAGAEPFVTASGARQDDIVRAVRACPSGALSYAIDGTEARDQVDQDRPPAIEVSKDGPYRITGGIPLTDGHGTQAFSNRFVVRAARRKGNVDRDARIEHARRLRGRQHPDCDSDSDEKTGVVGSIDSSFA